MSARRLHRPKGSPKLLRDQTFEEYFARAKLPKGDPRRLTRSKAKTKRERQAVHAFEYERRVGGPSGSDARDQTTLFKGRSVRSRVGHHKAGDQLPSVVALVNSADGGVEYKDLGHVSRSDAHKAVKHALMMLALVNGQLDPHEFERKVSTWKPINGEYLASDPAAVLAASREWDPSEHPYTDWLIPFQYTSGRPQ